MSTDKVKKSVKSSQAGTGCPYILRWHWTLPAVAVVTQDFKLWTFLTLPDFEYIQGGFFDWSALKNDLVSDYM